MLSKALLSLLFTSIFLTTATTNLVYEALKSDSLEQVETALKKLESDKVSSLSKAYQGTLIMKKADFMKTPKQKIATFKKGHQLLEAEITSHPKNAEYRFLRLLIQENAPKILKYNKNLDEDKKIIIANYSNFSPFLQAFIKDYSKNSPTLKNSDLN